MVACGDGFYARSNVDDHARALVAENRGEQSFGVGPGQGEFVGVADAGGFDLDEHFTGLGPIELNGGDGERFPRLERHRSTHIH